MFVELKLVRQLIKLAYCKFLWKIKMQNKIIASLLLSVFMSVEAIAADSYDLTTGVLAIPLVKVGTSYYRNVQITLNEIKSVWTSHATVDKLKPQFEARSNASGLTPPKWLCRRVRL
jgi:hypothetical protein